MTAPALTTERLLLREWHDSDRAPYAALNADPDVMRHFPSRLTPQQSDEMVDRMIVGWRDRGFGLWAVERIETGDFIGSWGSLHLRGKPPSHLRRNRMATRKRIGQRVCTGSRCGSSAVGVRPRRVPDDEISASRPKAHETADASWRRSNGSRTPEATFDHTCYLIGWTAITFCTESIVGNSSTTWHIEPGVDHSSARTQYDLRVSASRTSTAPRRSTTTSPSTTAAAHEFRV